MEKKESIAVASEIRELLDNEASRINSPEFIAEDPVQFPRRYAALQDIEIASFLSAMIAWGNRKMICRDADRMLELMDNQPFRYVMDEGYEDLPFHKNIHRTFFSEHLAYFLRGLHRIYKDFGSLDAFSHAVGAGEDTAPAWKLVENMQKVLCDANRGETCSRCLPLNLRDTALKRVNMALRWLVRDDGIVDMGVWKSIGKRKLYIPLDVHVGNVSRELGLLTRKGNDRKSVEELTGVLRILRPEDPAVYDFALFGIGVEGRMKPGC